MNLDEIYEQAEREDKLVAVVKYPYQKPEAYFVDSYGFEFLPDFFGAAQKKPAQM